MSGLADEARMGGGGGVSSRFAFGPVVRVVKVQVNNGPRDGFWDDQGEDWPEQGESNFLSEEPKDFGSCFKERPKCRPLNMAA